MSVLPLQLMATLGNLTHNTQHALHKANQLNPHEIPDIASEPGPFLDVCEYVGDLITLTRSGSGLRSGGKITTKSEQGAVYDSFEEFSKYQQEFFNALATKSGDDEEKAKASRLVAKLKSYEKTFDTFIDQLADQCPDVAGDITTEHRAVTSALQKAVAAWALPEAS